jgi:hypothetical protein
VTNPGFNILLILIRCLLTPEKAPCHESGAIFLDNRLWRQFSFHVRDFQCWKSYQKAQSSIRIISFARDFQDCTMKRREFAQKWLSSFFSPQGQFDVPESSQRL